MYPVIARFPLPNGGVGIETSPNPPPLIRYTERDLYEMVMRGE